jgi:hypothetical protein
MKFINTKIVQGAVLLGAILLTACGGGVGGAADGGTVPNQPQTAPVIAVQPAIQYVKPGNAATFTVVATGTGPLHYQWKRNGANVGSDSSSYTTLATTTADNGEKYLVVVSNAAGSVTSGEATLTVNASDLPAAIQSPPQNITVTAGETATFTVVAGGTAPLHYQWKKGTTAVGTDSAGLTFTNALTTDAGSYTVTVSNAVNSVTSTSATLTVNPTPMAPTITTQPKPITVTEGGAANFTVVAAGSSPLHYQWKKGTTAVGTDSAGLTFTNALTTDAGSYTVTVTNAVGSVTSSVATLNVNALTTISVGVSPANVTLGVGATQAFTASVTGSSNEAVTWTSTGGTFSNSVSNPGQYTAPTTAGNYVVRATSQADTSKYAEATVKVVAAGHQIRVLFLGNSFINEHILSAQVMGLAQAAGLDFYAEEYTIGGSNLKQHWDASDQASLKNIQAGGWDFVVLEPFWHAYGSITKEQELVYAQYFDAEIKKIGARTVIFSTWALGWAAVGKPTDANLWDYNHEETADIGNHWMAQQLGALEVRAGDAWQVSYLRYPSILLYESDGCHPNNTGHYFTAALFLIALTGVDPTGNTYLPPPSPDAVSTTDAALMRALAWELR